MSRKTVSAIMLSLLVTSTLTLAFDIRPAFAQAETVYIKAEGSISPPTAPINTLDNVTYVLVDNLTEGITVQRSNIVIDGNGHTLDNALNASVYGFYMLSADNVTIKNATITEFGVGVYFENSSGDSLPNIVIANSYPILEFVQGILLVNTNDSQIVNNKIANNARGVCLQSCFGNNVSGNKGTYNDVGFALYNSCNNILSDDNFEGGLDVGGFLQYSCNNTLSGNYVTGYSLDSGLHFDYSDNNTLIGNYVTGNGRGIYLENSDNNTLMANNAKWSISGGPGEAGVPPGVDLELDCSSNNIVLDNNITNSNSAGVWLSSAFNNTLVGNTVAFNSPRDEGALGTWGAGDGISIDSSSNNTIYHNNFFGNAIQFSSDGLPNMWDNGYPSGGNYWSDYNGTDANHDGIGDTPYNIDASNTDHYPLMVQYLIPEFPSLQATMFLVLLTLLAVITYKKKGVKTSQS